MSYSKTDLGRLYEVRLEPPVGNALHTSVNVPVEQVVNDFLDYVVEQSPRLTRALVDKNWPFLQSKVVELIPPVVDSTLAEAKKRNLDVQKLITTIAAPSAKRIAFFSAIGAVGLLTAFAIVRKKTKG